MRVQSKGLYDEDDDDTEALSKIRRQEPFSLQEENEISTEITPQEIPDIRRLGILSAIQGVPGVSNAESAEIEASPSAPPADTEMHMQDNLPTEESVEEPSFLGRLGRALSSFTQPSQQDVSQQEQMPVSYFPENIQSVPEDDHSNYLHAGMRRQYESSPETDFYRNSPAAMQFASPQINQQIEEENKVKVANFQKRHAEMQATGIPDIIDGEIEALDADPSAQAQFEEITGRDYTEDLSKELKNYVNASNSATEALNDEAQAIRDRIAGGAESMTDKDKFMLGLSVLIPVILAGAFGSKEGAIGALSGGLNGLAQVLSNENQIDSTKDLKRLSEIEKDKLDIEKQISEQKEKAEKNLNKATEIKGRNIQLPPELEGRKAKVFRDNKTGEEKIGIRAGNDDLLYDARNITKGNSKEDVKHMNELAADAVNRTKAAREIETELNHYDDILNQLEKKGVTGFLDASLGAAFSGGQNIFSAKVKDPLTGKEVNASAVLSDLREKVLDKYRTMLGGNRALTSNIKEHFEKLLPNPFDFDNKLSVSEARNIGKTFKGVSLREFVDGLETEGFLREPLESKYLRPIHEERILGQQKEKQGRQVSQSTKAIRENPNLREVGSVVEVDI